LTHRLAECPAEFLMEPANGGAGIVHVAAVLADLLTDLGMPPAKAMAAGAAVEALSDANAERRRNRLGTLLISAWLFHDPWFRARDLSAKVHSFLHHVPPQLAELVKSGLFVSDPDRREELARLGLSALGYCPAGETQAQAQDRLTTISSLERQRVIRESQAAEARMRQIREAMQRKAAEEAAAKLRRE
jgi:hypothetical protein